MLNTLEEIAKVHQAWTTSDNPRVALGFPFFDDATGGGCGQGEVLLCLGGAGAGKTWWACNVIVNNPHVPTVVFSRRIQQRFFLQRLAAVHTGQSTREIEQQMQEGGRSEAIERTVSDFPNLAVTSVSEMSLEEMSGGMRAFTDDTYMFPRLVVIDDLELIEIGGSARAADHAERVVRLLKAWAREHAVTVLVLNESGAARSRSGSRLAARFGRKPTTSGDFAQVTRPDAKAAGSTGADYTVGVFWPTSDSDVSSTDEAEDVVLMLQLLKNHGGYHLHETGVAHHVCLRNWQISPMS